MTVDAKSVLIAALGNPLAGDDGLGAEVIGRLAAGPLPPGVQLYDAGTDSLRILEEMKGARQVVIVDAVRFGAEPGRWFEAKGEDLAACAVAGPNFSLHQPSLLNLIALARALGLEASFRIFGMEPAGLELGASLSPEVRAAAASLTERIRRFVFEFQIRYEEKAIR